MTRGIDNRLIVQGLSELRRVLCGPPVGGGVPHGHAPVGGATLSETPPGGMQNVLPLTLLVLPPTWVCPGPIFHSHRPSLLLASLVLKSLPVPDTSNPMPVL